VDHHLLPHRSGGLAPLSEPLLRLLVAGVVLQTEWQLATLLALHGSPLLRGLTVRILHPELQARRRCAARNTRRWRRVLTLPELLLALL
jgi:hypothetical protein